MAEQISSPETDAPSPATDAKMSELYRRVVLCIFAVGNGLLSFVLCTGPFEFIRWLISLMLVDGAAILALLAAGFLWAGVLNAKELKPDSMTHPISALAMLYLAILVSLLAELIAPGSLALAAIEIVSLVRRTYALTSG